ncbi:MAG: hypothetical protein RID91_15185 [Azospirillaceae bacterium]
MAKDTPTQVGHALGQLGIRHMAAYSPEARGRGERLFATLQDRLPKELADAGITTVEAANRFIAEVYLPAHNRRFAVAAEHDGSAFVPWSAGALEEVLCHQEDRVVAHDNTVTFGRPSPQIPPGSLRPHSVKARVQVRRYPDGRLALFHGPRCIARFQADGHPDDATGIAA